MTDTSSKTGLRRLVEWLAAIIGAVFCVLVPLGFGAGMFGSFFPFPGLYFIEITLVGVLVLWWVAWPRLGVRWPALPWVGAGILLAFVILGGFSIGPALIPAFLAFLLVGILADRQAGRPMARHFAYLLVAAVIQMAVMGLIILIDA